MEKEKISDKQKEILEYIKEQIVERGFPPSVREICAAVNLKSTSSVHMHLSILEKNGYIRRDPAKPRCIEIADESFSTYRKNNINVPILGQVTAGLPILAVENIEGYFPLPSESVPSGYETFMLRVKGQSMKDVGIYDKDLILVRSQSNASNGDKVVALVDGEEVTVKTFYKEDGYVRLQPENEDFQPIITENCQILGKVIGLFRLFR